MDRLANKVALVTGAASGLGKAIATRFIAEGARVMISDINIEAGEAVAREIGASFIPHDVSDEPGWKTVLDETVQGFGGLHILVNNAGMEDSSNAEDPENTTLASWERIMAVNAGGVFLGCKHGIPALLRQGGGAILNTASIVALMGSSPSQIAYTASKGAVVSMTREIAVCYARRGIRANVICPGPIETEMTKQVIGEAGLAESYRVHLPMGRMGTPQEIAGMAAYLVSDEASYVTGQTISVDGGLTSAYLCPPD